MIRDLIRISVFPPRLLLLIGTAAFGLTPAGCAAEGPFFITYTHQMEEPGNLEFGTKNVIGKPNGGNRFLATTAEFEYGVKAWWTSELSANPMAGIGSWPRLPNLN